MPDDLHTILDIGFCVRAVFFAHERDEQFPYSDGGGTGFFVQYSGRVFVVTARHVVRDRNRDEIRVLYSQDKPRFVTFDMIVSDTHPRSAERDYSDIVLLSVELDAVSHENQRLFKVINLDAVRCSVAGARHGDVLVIGGFPGDKRAIDYEGRKLQYAFVTALAHYIGPDERLGIHRCEIVDFPATTLNGLSGAPVFLMRPIPSGVATFRLAGVLLQGDRDAGIAHFVAGEVVMQFIRSATASK